MSDEDMIPRDFGDPKYLGGVLLQRSGGFITLNAAIQLVPGLVLKSAPLAASSVGLYSANPLAEVAYLELFKPGLLGLDRNSFSQYFFTGRTYDVGFYQDQDVLEKLLAQIKSGRKVLFGPAIRGEVSVRNHLAEYTFSGIGNGNLDLESALRIL